VHRRRNACFTKIIQQRPNSTVNIVRSKSLFKGIPGMAERSGARGKNIGGEKLWTGFKR